MSLSVLVHSASNLGDQKQDNLKFFTVVTLEGKQTAYICNCKIISLIIVSFRELMH